MARYYRKVEIAMWIDDRFRSLSAPQPNAQTLWLYLLTGPRTVVFPGLVVAREAVLADDLGWSIEAFREAFGEVSREGLAKADWKAGLVVLAKALFDSSGEPRESSKPESPNVIKSWERSWDLIPECDLKRQYLQQFGSFCEALGEGFGKAYREAFRKALAKPSPNQETGNREQETGNRKQEEREDARVPRADSPALDLFKQKVDKATGDAGKRRARKAPEYTAEETATALRVLKRLGERNGVAYTGASEHVRLIVNQLRAGVSEHELLAVIGYCAVKLDWLNKPAMAEYLRPKTLFGSEKIHDYLDPARTWARDEIEEARRQSQAVQAVVADVAEAS